MVGDGFAGGDEVAFGDVAVGEAEVLGDVAVVGEEDEAGAGAVEAAAEVEVVRNFWREEVEDGGEVGVAAGAEDACGFVEGDEAAGFARLDEFGVPLDA